MQRRKYCPSRCISNQLNPCQTHRVEVVAVAVVAVVEVVVQVIQGRNLAGHVASLCKSLTQLPPRTLFDNEKQTNQSPEQKTTPLAVSVLFLCCVDILSPR